MSFTTQYNSRLQELLNNVDLSKVDQAIALLDDARKSGAHVFICGNGGSASSASHFACDLGKGASYQRKTRFKVLSLNDCIPTMTAYSNDVSYECAYLEQLKNFAKPGDVVITVSGSGNSANVVQVASYANSIGCKTIGLTGRDGGKLGPLCQLNIHVPNQHMGLIEDAHMIILHMIAYYFMEQPQA